MSNAPILDALAGLPDPWPDDLLPELAAASEARPLIVLDDDPTGTQTVRDVTVLTEWSAPSLAHVFASGERVTYVLTNSRALPRDGAIAVAREIGSRLREVADRRPFRVVSRSDSTLRGHFPAEVDALASALGTPDAPVLLAPYFDEGGRITVGDVHYLRGRDEWIPVAKTEFAADPTFGYGESNLVEWVTARTNGDRPVTSLPLALIRTGGPDAVAAALTALPPHAVCAVNAAVDRELEVVAAAAARIETPLMVRSAASWVRIAAGQARADILGPATLGLHGGPGLIVVGSHVPLTTRQLARLRAEPPVPLAWFELDVPALLAGHASDLAPAIDEALRGGMTAVLATSRERVSGEQLGIGTRVSGALVENVRSLRQHPAWLLAKGGITSSDMATDALDMRRARVVGQLVSGVPVWRSGPDSRWPGLPLIVFPGNVGDDDALRLAVARLTEGGG
jgi:uncharacterized protein YgbK (DUF1537 family)